MRQELIDKLINRQKIMDDECFELSIGISRLLNTNDESKQSNGRELIIRVLDTGIISQIAIRMFLQILFPRRAFIRTSIKWD